MFLNRHFPVCLNAITVESKWRSIIQISFFVESNPAWVCTYIYNPFLFDNRLYCTNQQCLSWGPKLVDRCALCHAEPAQWQYRMWLVYTNTTLTLEFLPETFGTTGSQTFVLHDFHWSSKTSEPPLKARQPREREGFCVCVCVCHCVCTPDQYNSEHPQL